MPDPQIDDWLKQFPREAVQARVDELEGELARWRSALDMHEALAGRQNGAGDDVSGRPNKPQAILRILAESDKPLKPMQIRDKMIERGWLEKGPKFSRRFYSTMSRMTAENRIKRLAGSKYVLSEPEGSESLLG